MDTPIELRARAAKARHFAETMIHDPLTVDRLTELAVDLESRADAEERNSRMRN